MKKINSSIDHSDTNDSVERRIYELEKSIEDLKSMIKSIKKDSENFSKNTSKRIEELDDKIVAHIWSDLG